VRVALYARVSTADKDQHPETQLRPLREHLTALGRTGEVEPVGEFADRASADDLQGRRAWRRLLDLAHRRRVDLVVVWKLDRAIRWYCRYRLSAADVRDLLAERHVDVSARTVLAWAHKLGPLLAAEGRRQARPVGIRWYCDETYVRVGLAGAGGPTSIAPWTSTAR
jgi:hypothetical protein